MLKLEFALVSLYTSWFLYFDGIFALKFLNRLDISISFFTEYFLLYGFMIPLLFLPTIFMEVKPFFRFFYTEVFAVGFIVINYHYEAHMILIILD